MAKEPEHSRLIDGSERRFVCWINVKKFKGRMLWKGAVRVHTNLVSESFIVGDWKCCLSTFLHIIKKVQNSYIPGKQI